MEDIDYLASGPVKRAFIRLGRRLKELPRRTADFFGELPKRAGRCAKRISGALTKYALIFLRGDLFTKLSFVIMGAGCIRRKRFVKGLLYLAIQVVFWIFILNSGIGYIAKLRTLGTEVQTEIWNEEKGIFEYTKGDNSMLVLLYGIISLITVFVSARRMTVKCAHAMVSTFPQFAMNYTVLPMKIFTRHCCFCRASRS